MVAPRSPPSDPRVDIAALQRDVGAQLFQALQVQIDRTGADGAAAGQ